MPRYVEVPGVGEVEFPDTMDDGAIVQAIETDILPGLRRQSSAEMDRVLAPPRTPPSARLPQPQAAPVKPFYQRPAPMPGTFDPATGKALEIPGIPLIQPPVEYLPGPMSPQTVSMRHGQAVVDPGEGPSAIDTAMRAANQAVMGTVGGVGTAAKVAGTKLKQFEDWTAIPGQQAGTSPTSARVGSMLEQAGEGIREFAQRGTSTPGVDYANAFWIQNPWLLMDPNYLAHQVGQAGGSMVSFLMPTVGMLSRAQQTVGGVAAMSGLESLVNAAETYDTFKSRGATDTEAANAFIQNVGMDFPATFATNLANPIFDRLLRAKPATRAVTGTLMEGAQEPMQGAIQRSVTGDPITEGMDVEFLGGMLGGPVGAGIMSGAEAASPNDAPTIAQPTAPRRRGTPVLRSTLPNAGPVPATAGDDVIALGGAVEASRPRLQELAQQRAEARRRWQAGQQGQTPVAPAPAPDSQVVQGQPVQVEQQTTSAPTPENPAQIIPENIPDLTTSFRPRAYEEIQADIDREETRIIERGGSPEKMYDPAERTASDLPAGWEPMPPQLAQLYRERFQREQIDDNELASGLNDSLRKVISDEAKRADFVKAVGEFDKSLAVRGGFGKEAWKDIGRIANEALRLAIDESGHSETTFGEVRARLAGIAEDPGVQLEILGGGRGYDLPSAKTIGRAQEILDALMGGNAPNIPIPMAKSARISPTGEKGGDPVLIKDGAEGPISEPTDQRRQPVQPEVVPPPAPAPTNPTQEVPDERQLQASQAEAIPQAQGEVAPARGGTVTKLSPGDIAVDPVRFQFKQQGVGQKGVTDEFKEVRRWDPEKAGIISVWKDPADGKTYVVNGHHRVEMANRLGAQSVTVRYLDAPDAKTARLKGALINIAEGRGESLDAAKVFRDSGMTPQQLEEDGVSLRGRIAREGLALANLAPALFQEVSQGTLPIRRAAIIGENVKNHNDQLIVLDMARREERSGKRLTDEELNEMISIMSSAPRKSELHDSLFGSWEEERSLFPEMAKVSSYIRKQLQSDKKLFGAVATGSAAERLAEIGNKIEAEKNADVARNAQQAQELYDKLRTASGPISSAINTAAERIANGESVDKVAKETYATVRAELKSELAKYSGRPASNQQGSGQGTDRLGEQGARDTGAGQQATAEDTVTPDDDASGPTAAYEPPESDPTVAFNPMNRLLGKGSTPQPSAATMQTIERRSQIIKDLQRAFDKLPPHSSYPPNASRPSIAQGRLGTIAAAIYKVVPEKIRLKNRLDYVSFSHELGHHIHKFIWGSRNTGLNNRPLMPWADELRDLDYDQDKRRIHEGFAEYIRLWLTEPGQAQQKAPRFHAFFEQTLESYVDLRAALVIGRDRIAKWENAPAAAKILGSIDKEDGDQPRHWYKLWFRNFDEFYRQMVDKNLPWFRLVSHMEKRGAKWKDANPAQLAQLMAGWWGKANEFLHNATFDFDTLEDSGPSLKTILKPIATAGKSLGPAAQRIMQDMSVEDNHDEGLDDLRVYLLAKRAIEKAGQGIETGIPLDVAKAALADLQSLDADRYRQLEEAATKLYAYQNSILDYAQKAGLFSAEQIARMREMNMFYVPFYRAFDPEERMQGAGKAGSRQFANVADPTRKMKGSDREILDPVASIIKNTYAIISAAERNYAVAELAKRAEITHGAGAFMDLVPPEKYPIYFNLQEIEADLKNAGIAVEGADLDAIANIWRRNVRPDASKYMVSVVIDGNRKLYEVSPEMYQALTFANRGTSNIFLKLLSAYARMLRVGATALSPDFVIRNPIRDTWTAFMQSEFGFIPVLDNVRGFLHVVGKSKTFAEWKRAGGEHAAMLSLDRGSLNKSLQELLGNAKGMSYYAMLPFQAMMSLSETMELSTRLGEYSKARKKGATERQAAFAARTVTIDFARSGLQGEMINRAMSFWNAQVQGTDMFLRLHRGANLKRSAVRGFTSITIPSIILWLLNKDDPDYQELPNYIKDNFWLIPTKGTISATKWIPIPKPFLWGQVYGTMFERTLEAVWRDNPDAFEGFHWSLLGSAGFGPNMILPTGVTALVSLIANKDFFTGQPIDPPYENRSPSRRAKPNTSEFSRVLARMLDKAGGPEISPNKIDHAIFGATAGAGRAAVGLIDWFIPDGDTPRPTKRWRDIPGVRAFIVPETYGRSQQKMYERAERLKQLVANRKADRSEPDLTLDEKKEQSRVGRAVKKAAEKREKIRSIYQAKDMTPEQKRAAIDAIERDINRLARETMRKR